MKDCEQQAKSNIPSEQHYQQNSGQKVKLENPFFY